MLLDRYYATEEGIPADQVYRLARARTDEEKAAVDSVLADFFIREEKPTGFVWVNRRVEEELGKARQRIETARENGKKGGRPPKKPKQNPDVTQKEPSGFSLGYENETQMKAHQAPITNHQLEEQKHERQAARGPSRFDEFWAVYPNKKGKADALKAWRRKGLDMIADLIIGDVNARAAGDRQWLEGFIPHGSTYVNAEGWQDAIEPPRRQAASGYVPLPGEF